MNKKNKTYSVIIVSDATSTNREFLVSSKLLKNSVIAITTLVLFFGFVIYDYLTTTFNKERMKRLEQMNIQQEKTIETLNAEIKSHKRSLKRMEIYKERIMVASGLKSPYALKEVGYGGYDYEVTTTDQISSAVENEAGDRTPGSFIQDARRVTEQAKKIENTLKFVESVIDQQKVRLASTPAIWPTKGYLTDVFGWRIHPITGKRSFHYGQDISTQLGNKVIATADGFVLAAERRGTLGNLVIIDHGFGYSTWYGHLARYAVKEGDRVKRGQVVGYVGSTGRSNAPHLHYEVRVFGKPQNPMKFIID